jgi:putative metallohydrolase (TIGR04338 family)
MARPRDAQRQRLYRAEWEFRGKNNDGPHAGRIFTSIAEVQAYTDRLLAEKWFQRRWCTPKRIDIEAKHHGAATAWPSRGLISMPKWAWCEQILLHEIAHCITDRYYVGFDRVAIHGREFAAINLELVGHKQGKAAAEALKVLYRKHKVKFTKPRAKRVLTEEQRQVLRDRLAAARAAKVAVAA